MNAPCGTGELTCLNSFSKVSSLLSGIKWEGAGCWDCNATFPVGKTASYSTGLAKWVLYTVDCNQVYL